MASTTSLEHTENIIREHLLKHNVTFEKATRLHGGKSTYAWRLDGCVIPKQGAASSTKTSLETSSYITQGIVPGQQLRMRRPCVLKYADTKFADFDGDAPIERMQYEARAMSSSIFRDLSSGLSGFKMAKLIFHTEQSVLVAWAGATILHSLCEQPEASKYDFIYLGKEIGTWLAHLHRIDVNTADGSGMWQNSYQEMWFGQNSGSADIEYGYFKELGHSESFLSELLDLRRPVRRTLCHGDFRPGNMMVEITTTPKTEDKKKVRLDVTAIDFEASGLGSPVLDVAFFAWDSYCSVMVSNRDTGLLDEFYRSYVKEAGHDFVDERFVFELAAEIGSLTFRFTDSIISDWKLNSKVLGHLEILRVALIEAAVNKDLDKLAGMPILSSLVEEAQKSWQSQ